MHPVEVADGDNGGAEVGRNLAQVSPDLHGGTLSRSPGWLCNDPGVESSTARVLVTGATGFIGSRLAGQLEADGHEVLAMTRHPETYAGAGRAVGADVGDRASLTGPLAGVDVAYY
ncbi:MAG: NAD-dependent epimerase/dehydratase family protein, partial [Myxococcales bacterium]